MNATAIFIVTRSRLSFLLVLLVLTTSVGACKNSTSQDYPSSKIWEFQEPRISNLEYSGSPFLDKSVAAISTLTPELIDQYEQGNRGYIAQSGRLVEYETGQRQIVFDMPKFPTLEESIKQALNPRVTPMCTPEFRQFLIAMKNGEIAQPVGWKGGTCQSIPSGIGLASNDRYQP